VRCNQYRIVYWIQDDIAIVQVLKAGKKTPGFYDDL
jgi:mRNA-degrading endonuclease RelE of RelBE toxin-antitoxin system